MAKDHMEDMSADAREALLRERLLRLEELEKKLDVKEQVLKEKEKAQKESEKAKKQILLRLAPTLWEELAGWAAEDFRSINGQIEFLLSEAVKRHKNK